jgi:hypothetical protein
MLEAINMKVLVGASVEMALPGRLSIDFKYLAELGVKH